MDQIFIRNYIMIRTFGSLKYNYYFAYDILKNKGSIIFDIEFKKLKSQFQKYIYRQLTSSNCSFPFFGVWRVLEIRLSGGWEKFELSYTKRGATEKHIFDSKRVEDIRLKLAPPPPA